MTDALFKDMSNRFPAGTAPSNWTRSYPGQFPCRHALSNHDDDHVLPLARRWSPSRGRIPPPLGRPERDVHHRLRIHAPTDDRPISRQPRRGGSAAHLPGPFPSVGHGREAPGQAARRCGHRGHDRTSPEGSQFICHTKGIVCLDPAPWCWEGSVNFSVSGWHQLNTAMSFSSKDWAKNFVDQFRQIRQFAWDYERAFQLMPKPPTGVKPNPNPPPLRKRTPSVTPR